MTSAPTPPKLGKAKAAAVTAAAMATTAALTFGLTSTAPEVLAGRNDTTTVSQPMTREQTVELLASIGIYPTGPLFQVARLAGLGNPDAALNTLQNLASLIGQAELASLIETVRGVLDDLGAIVPVDARVPGFGPAGIIDAVDSLEGDILTQGLLTTLKTVLLNLENVAAVAPILAGLGIDIPPEILQYINLVGTLPLNVPGTSIEVGSGVLDEILEALFPDFPGLSLGAFLSDADKLAIIPGWGLGGTNFALASPTFLTDPAFADTAILAILFRNTSRPGGGIVALLNPFSQLVGLNLANVDGRGTPVEDTISIGFTIPILGWEINIADVDVTKYDGNVTVWDITAAYDLLSDAPSTIWNPVAWANSGVGFVMPTYLIPSTITQILDGDVIGGLLASLGMLKIDVSDYDGNLYITYDSGNLPLLEPFQFLPRTLSYFPGFDISTPVSSSFEQALRTLVATGYQDVDVTDTDGDGVYSFVRGWDMGGKQAYFWENPITFTQGLELPQTLLNEIVDGLSANLLDPANNSLELFGDNTLTNLLYNNELAIPVATFIRDGLNQVMAALNPVINDIQEPLKSVTQLLDDATNQVNTFIRNGLAAGAANPIVDLEGPMLEVNRWINDVTAPLDNGIPNAIGNAINGNSTSSSLLAADTGNSGPQLFNVAADDVPSGGTDFLGNNELTQRASSVASSLKKQRESLQASAEKQTTKTQRSLDKRANEAKDVATKLSKGEIGEAAKAVGDNVTKRVERLGKDINNGVKKVTGQDKNDNKNDAAA